MLYHFYLHTVLLLSVYSVLLTLYRYSGGQIKTWNISSDETQTFECESKALQLIEEDNEESLGQSINCVTCVKSSQGDIVAGYKHGKYSIHALNIKHLKCVDYLGNCLHWFT